MALLGLGFLVSCSKSGEGVPDTNTPKGIETYAYFSVKVPGKIADGKTVASPGSRVDLPEDYNPDETFSGNDDIVTVDLYMQRVGGTENGTLEKAIRFVAADGDLSINGNAVSPAEPFRTTSGTKNLYIVINDTENIGSSVLSENTLIDCEKLAKILDGKDVIMMTGVSRNIDVKPSITPQQAATGQENQFPVSVIRVASRVVVTLDRDLITDVNTSNFKGKISDITYSVAQSAKKIYWLPQNIDNNPKLFNSYGYGWVPNEVGMYEDPAGASLYYDYSDLLSPAAVPVNSAEGDGYKSFPGKFLYENTHFDVYDRDLTGYRKGNTAYVLIKAIFTPDPTAFEDDGTPSADGTFYVGASDGGKIYTSLEAAQIGRPGQKVYTYKEGKMLYYAWLNPDNIEKPLNSPVVRNNIYHINIKSFKKLGFTWNPLYPGIDNPDPMPVGPEEPNSSIDPIDPLTPEETYMAVEINVEEWTSHSYDVDL